MESASNTFDEMARSRESPESPGAVIEINKLIIYTYSVEYCIDN